MGRQYMKKAVLVVASLALLAVLGALTWKFAGRPADVVLMIVGTFLAAWAGGWAAFRAERNTRNDAEKQSRISAANRALFTVATLFNVFNNLRQHYIDAGNVRDRANRTLDVDSPQSGMMQEIHFDFDSLNYFLACDGDVSSMALMELQVLEWHYHVLVNTVELRAAAIVGLHRAIAAKPMVNASPDAIKAFFAAEWRRLDAITDQFILLVDDGISKTKQMNTKMQVALQSQYPSQSFLQINFEQKPQIPPVD